MRTSEGLRGAAPKQQEAPSTPRCSGFHANYELREEVLGTGVCGGVREAVCRKTGRTVAVKSFDKKAMNRKALASLRSELDIHTRLAHPGIVKLEATFESESESHMVMEKLAGGELFARIVERDRLCERDAAGVALQVLQVLVYLHGQRIMHRDIKPENVIYHRRGGSNVALIDFGFATSVHPGLKQRCGSLQYVAPEILGGFAYNEKADVWSLGSVVYSMLTGEVLFDGKTKDQVFRQNVSGSVSFSRRFRSLSAEARDFVRQLLILDSQERPSAREALEHPWLRSMTCNQKEVATLDVSTLWRSAWRWVGLICS